MTQTMVGSPIYMAPEVLRGEDYGNKADVWSCGVMFYEILFGKCPFEDKTIPRLINKISRSQAEIPRSVSAPVAHVLRRCLEKDPDYRATWEEIFHMTDELIAGIKTQTPP